MNRRIDTMANLINWINSKMTKKPRSGNQVNQSSTCISISSKTDKSRKKHTSTLLNICPLNLIRDIFKPFKDCGHTLVSTNLHHDPRYCRVHHTEKRKNDQVGNDHEEKVSSGHRTVQAGTCGRSLVLGDFADDDRKKEAKERGDNRWEDTRNHGKLDSRFSKWIQLIYEKDDSRSTCPSYQRLSSPQEM